MEELWWHWRSNQWWRVHFTAARFTGSRSFKSPSIFQLPSFLYIFRCLPCENVWMRPHMLEWTISNSFVARRPPHLVHKGISKFGDFMWSPWTNPSSHILFSLSKLGWPILWCHNSTLVEFWLLTTWEKLWLWVWEVPGSYRLPTLRHDVIYVFPSWSFIRHESVVDSTR